MIDIIPGVQVYNVDHLVLLTDFEMKHVTGILLGHHLAIKR